jgi:hypothetical protein
LIVNAHFRANGHKLVVAFSFPMTMLRANAGLVAFLGAFSAEMAAILLSQKVVARYRFRNIL